MNKCGTIAIVGRPNVGKSTLLNHLLGQKISITSRRPQTTRHRIVGIEAVGDTQLLYVDTPGLHRKTKDAMGKYLNRAADQSLRDISVVVFVVDSIRWYEDDQWVLDKLKNVSVPVIVAVNKIDKLDDKTELLPYMQSLNEKGKFAALVPIAAKNGVGIDDLRKEIVERVPECEWVYPEDQVTDRSEKFLAAEIIREKLTRTMGQELPYAMTVMIEEFEVRKKVLHIGAVIYVERDSQKAMVIGNKGERLKKVGQRAREDMEKLFERKVFLRTWVKVKSSWADDERALRAFGYE